MMHIYKIIISLIFPIGLQAAVFAQTIRGKVTDAQTGESLIGATVFINETKQTSFVELDGYFNIKNIKPGQYTLNIRFIGYDQKSESITVNTTDNKTIWIKLQSSAKELNSVGVTGYREADVKERKLEKDAPQLLNAVSAKAIELSPDITIGNVLQRVSGVTVQRSSSGDGQFPVIRGLGQRYNYTSIDGIILPSPDATQRSVPLDIFPADLIQRVEVVKSLTPDLEANAIGGATNLVMKEGPDKLTITANLGAGQSTVFAGRPFVGFSTNGIHFKDPVQENGSRYLIKLTDLKTNQFNLNNVNLPLNFVSGLTIGDKIFNHKLGYMFGGSLIREYRGGNTLLYTSNGVGYLPNANTPTFSTYENREYSFLQTRLGLHAKFNYALTTDHNFSLYSLFLQLDNNQESNIVKYLSGSGTVVAGEIDYINRVIINRKNMAHTALSGHDKIVNKLYADWTLSYASAKAFTPNQGSFVTYQDNAASPVVVSNLPITWQSNSDIDKTGILNFKYTPHTDIEITTGGLYRAKERIGIYNDYTVYAAPTTNIPTSGRQPYTTVDNAVFQFKPYPAGAMGDTTNLNNYTAHETVSAAYIEAQMLFGKLHIITGVREETTKQDYLSKISPALPNKSGNFHYTDILPGLHLRYALTDKQNLRLSYFASITRPALYDLIPSTGGGSSASDINVAQGNPYLRHSTANNLDFRYDNFFSTTNYILVGLFYKRVSNPIEYGFFNPNGLPSATDFSLNTTYGPTNPGSDAVNYGFEFVASKYFGKFGVSSNYSYTHSSITTNKEYDYAVGSSRASIIVPQTRPMQGQVDHVVNMSLLFKDTKSGFDGQLSTVYNGKSIAIVSSYLNLDTWQRSNTQFDFSINKRFNPKLSIFFKATNLLSSKTYTDILHSNNILGSPGQTDPNRILIQQNDFKQTFLLGVRFKTI